MKKLVSIILVCTLMLIAACGTQAPAGGTAPEEPAQQEESPAAQPEKDADTEQTAQEQSAAEKAEEEPAEKPAVQEPVPEDTEEQKPEPEPGQEEKQPEQEQTAEPEPEPAPEPEPKPEPEPGPEPEPEPAPAPEPYSEPSDETILTVYGASLSHDWYFSLSDLMDLGGTVGADYFSRGKEPQEATNYFVGISVSYLLEQVVGAWDLSKAVFIAGDGYTAGHSRSAIDASYINEQDPSAVLSMILAWSEDGAPCALRLVMGQQIEGEYNRTYWTRGIVSIEVI